MTLYRPKLFFKGFQCLHERLFVTVLSLGNGLLKQ